MTYKDFQRLRQFMSGASSFSTIIFSGERFQPLFFSTLFEFLRRDHGAEFQPLTLLDDDLVRAQGGLSMSFLGQSHDYWCGDSTLLKIENQKKMLVWASHYKGPHRLALFADSKLVDGSVGPSTCLVIPCLLYADKSWYDEFVSVFFPEHNGVVSRDELDQRITLDEACALMRYHALVGNDRNFWKHWAPRIVGRDTSLFTLSQYFFARDAQQFFEFWNRVNGDYPTEFWIAFWAEQLWQSYGVLVDRNDQTRAPQRKPGGRLPFSFYQKDWRSCSTELIKRAFILLYTVDYGFKNGQSGIGFDRFFSLWFRGPKS